MVIPKRHAGPRRTRQVFGSGLLNDYTQTVAEVRQTGYLAYGTNGFRLYGQADAAQFSQKRGSLTQNFLSKRRGTRI
jgi:hypothetical protein